MWIFEKLHHSLLVEIDLGYKYGNKTFLAEQHNNTGMPGSVLWLVLVACRFLLQWRSNHGERPHHYLFYL